VRARLAAQLTRLCTPGCSLTDFTALPVLWSPVDQSSWAPPYEVTPASIAKSPLFLADQTCKSRGFEEPTLFQAPDGFLHFIGHNHGGQCSGGDYAHFISRNKSLASWQQAAGFSGQFLEPNPIPAAGDGIFGGQILQDWVDFGPQVSRDGLHFSSVSWQWSNASATVHSTRFKSQS
jgi:hypothetical protein